MTLTLQPVCVCTAPGQDSFLVLQDGCVVAVLVRLSAQYGEDAGIGSMTLGSAPLMVRTTRSFLTLMTRQSTFNVGWKVT